MRIPKPSCLRLLTQVIDLALDLARASAGSNMLARIAMMAMTTSSSMRVKAEAIRFRFIIRGRANCSLPGPATAASALMIMIKGELKVNPVFRFAFPHHFEHQLLMLNMRRCFDHLQRGFIKPHLPFVRPHLAHELDFPGITLNGKVRAYNLPIRGADQVRALPRLSRNAHSRPLMRTKTQRDDVLNPDLGPEVVTARFQPSGRSPRGAGIRVHLYPEAAKPARQLAFLHSSPGESTFLQPDKAKTPLLNATDA